MRGLIILVTLLVILPISVAQALESNSYDFKIIGEKVIVENELIFDKTQDINFTIDLPKDASALSLYINNKLEEPIIENNKIILDYSLINKIKLNYLTKELVEKNTFLVNLITPFDTVNFKIKLTLPEGAVLEKALENGISGSIYPKPDKATTDGKSMIFEWEKQDLEKDHELAIFVKYKPKSKLGFVIWLIGFLIAAIIILTTFVLKKPKTRVIVKKEEAIEKHLKEDEGQVISILKKRDGQCEQGTLRVITGFSKANLSRLLKELEDRRIIHKEKRGKKNLVFLKE